MAAVASTRPVPDSGARLISCLHDSCRVVLAMASDMGDGHGLMIQLLAVRVGMATQFLINGALPLCSE